MCNINNIKRYIERDGEFGVYSNTKYEFFDNSIMIYIYRKNKNVAERIVYVFKRKELTYSALVAVTERTKNKKHLTIEQKEDRILLISKLIAFKRDESLKYLLYE